MNSCRVHNSGNQWHGIFNQRHLLRSYKLKMWPLGVIDLNSACVKPSRFFTHTAEKVQRQHFIFWTGISSNKLGAPLGPMMWHSLNVTQNTQKKLWWLLTFPIIFSSIPSFIYYIFHIYVCPWIKGERAKQKCNQLFRFSSCSGDE